MRQLSRERLCELLQRFAGKRLTRADQRLQPQPFRRGVDRVGARLSWNARDGSRAFDQTAVQGIPSVVELATLSQQERDLMRALILKAEGRAIPDGLAAAAASTLPRWAEGVG